MLSRRSSAASSCSGSSAPCCGCATAESDAKRRMPPHRKTPWRGGCRSRFDDGPDPAARTADERHRPRQRPHRRRHHRLAPDRAPARIVLVVGGGRDHRRRQRLHDRQPAAEQRLRAHLDRPAHRGHRAADRQGREPRRRRPRLHLQAVHARAPSCCWPRPRSRRSPPRGSSSFTPRSSRPSSRRSPPRSPTGACRRSSSTASTRSLGEALNARAGLRAVHLGARSSTTSSRSPGSSSSSPLFGSDVRAGRRTGRPR